jgi:hypothetical protein
LLNIKYVSRVVIATHWQEEMGHVSGRVDHLESQNPNLSNDISAMRQAAEKLDAANAILRELLAAAKQHAETAADGSTLPAQTVQLYLARLEPLQTSDFVARTGLVSCPSNTTAWENRPAMTSQQVGSRLIVHFPAVWLHIGFDYTHMSMTTKHLSYRNWLFPTAR